MSNPAPATVNLDALRHHRVANGDGDPYRSLAAAVLLQAMRDARHVSAGRRGNGVSELEARRWLVGDPLAQFLADGVGLEREDVLRFVVAVAGK